MQRHCQHCGRAVAIRDTSGQEFVCSTCGSALSSEHVERTVDWSADDPQDKAIDGTVDMRTNPLKAESMRQPTNGRAESTIDETVEHVPGQIPPMNEHDRIEKTLGMFEDFWRAGDRPAIAAFLTDDTNRADLLVELTHLDLSYRLKAGEDARFEQYLEQFPELKRDRQAVLELILAEFRSRGRRGMNPTLESFMKRFPEFADELAVLLKQPPRSRQRRFPMRLNCPHCHNAIAVVDSEDDREVVCPSCHSAFHIDAERTQSWGPESLPMVGRFQLVKMLGRGAFGTVYQAKDTTLNRLVALKIPRSGTFSSRDDEDRFVAEAEHAAQLNHAGIVQVYDVGRTDDYPYIVTEFVRGVTLSDILTARRFSFAQAARLVATIADALHHAHEHQVIHRDLKPANIMIDTDDKPRVMDFGLAKRHVREITVALDGSILGTPAYMPPEQAGGKSQSADQRSDVYSLGVILFELLSGERPFRGNSVMLLHQVERVEAPKLRQLNDKIPLDLETIAAKCLEKDRDKRYQTAKELADDLRRHLNHEPIHARPIGRIERASRWCKRNPLLVKSAAAVFGTLVVALGVVSLFWRSESIQRHRADELAETNRELYDLERTARQEAVVAKEHALQRLRDARGAADLWLTVFPQQLEELPGGPQVREKFLLQAAEDYERFAKQQSGDPELELERGRSWLRLGDVRRMLAQDELAFGAYERAADVFAKLSGGSSAELAEAAIELATAWLGMGLVMQDMGQFEAAEEHIDRSISTLAEHLSEQTDNPRLQEVLAAAQLDFAVLKFETGNVALAEATISRAISGYLKLCELQPHEPRYRLGLASAESMLGELLAQAENYENARAGYDRALRTLDELIALNAENSEYLRARAEKRILLASLLRSLGDTDAELSAYEASAADYVRIDQQRPGLPVIRQQLAICLTNKGNLLQHLQRSREATEPLMEAITITDELVNAYGRPEYHEQLAAACSLLGEVYRDLGKYEESEQLIRSAIATFEKLADAVPSVRDYVERRAIARGQLGQTLVASDQTEAATHELRAAVREFDSLLAVAPDMPSYLNAAAYMNWHLGETIRSDPSHSTPATRPQPLDPSHSPPATRPQPLDPASREESNLAFARAVELWDKLSTTTPSPEYLNSFAWFFVTCSDAGWRDGERAIRLAERAAKLQQTNTHYRTTLGGAYFRHGDLASCEKTLSSLMLDGRAPGAGRFFLAMSLAKQKKLAEARQHYDAGMAWMLENQPGNRQLQRLQQEALTVIEAADVASSQ